MKIIKKILQQQLFISLLVLNTVIFILFSPNHYFFEMLQSMAFQIVLGISALALMFFFLKKWIGMSVSVLAVFLLISNISYLNPIKLYMHNPFTEKDVSIAHYNVLKFNNNYEKTIKSIHEKGADLVSINEMNYEWKAALIDGLTEQYPYHYLVAQHNSFGIGVFSKNPLSETETIWFEGIPYIAGNITVKDTNIKFLCAHTIPPTSKYAFAKRDGEIKHIENYLSKFKEAKIVIGDFNAVSWSPAMNELRSNLKLIDSRKGIQGTYPAWNKLLMIPIDHIFYSKEISCVSFQTISETDSDHYGIIGEYKL